MTENDRVRQWKRFAYAIARDFYFPTADQDDVNQEALVGLLTAVRTWNPALSSFKTFASLCIRKHLQASLTREGRGKHGPLTDSVRVHVDAAGEVGPVLDVIEGLRSDPADIVCDREDFQRLVAAIRDALTPLERRCLLGIANGVSYADLDATHHKSADNAVQRARVKLRAAA